MKQLLVFLLPVALCAQSDSALEQGRALFRSNCAFCHGMTARGGRGPNLVSAPLTHGDTDDAIKRVVRIGVPGTTMPAFSEFTDEELAQIIDYPSQPFEERNPPPEHSGRPARGAKSMRERLRRLPSNRRHRQHLRAGSHPDRIGAVH